MLENEGADGLEREMRRDGAGSSEEKFLPEILDGCQLDGLGDNEVKIVEMLSGEKAVREEVRGDVVEKKVSKKDE